jgi:vancomycin resistance protein YoaR
MYVQQKSNKTNKSPVIAILVFLFGFVPTCLVAILAGWFYLSSLNTGKIMPGVAVSGIDLSGQTPEQAVGALSQQVAYPTNGKIILTYGEKSWLASPTQLGYFFDLQGSVNQAYQYGRKGSLPTRILDQIRARTQGENLSLMLMNDQKTAQDFMLQVAHEIDRPVQEASLRMDGTNVIIQPGQTGLSVDLTNTMLLVQNLLGTQQDGVVPVAVKETQPAMLDLSAQADTVKKIISEPLVLSMPSGDTSGLGPWAIGQEDLAKMLVFTPIAQDDKKNIAIQLNLDLLRSFLQNLTPVIDVNTANARFTFNDETGQLDLLEHAQVGRTMDIEKSVTDISQAVLAGQHQVTLQVTEVQPAVPDTAKGSDLGITQLIHKEISYFYGSNSSRVNNIRTASSRFHGLLVAPGEVLSMSDVIGDVSLDTGFSEALIILGNQTIKGVGGGVCQVSTTLFRAAFFTGYPILERYPHAYRVGYYEQTVTGDSDPNLAGLDATVFVPSVDMKFKNDSPYWLLMETYVYENTLVWKFYSTADGRSVEWTTTGPHNIVKAPDPKYVENKKLDKGQIKQVDWSADGAEISVDRTVLKDGQVYFQDSFQTHYIPWQAVYEYGPGTKIPKKYRTDG